MKLAIMQPYIFPYIGYFQLINAVDVFVFYDDVNYINRGWINRNRILLNDKDYLFTIPLIKASQNKLINNIFTAVDEKLINSTYSLLHQAYRKAPFYNDVINMIMDILNTPHKSIAELAIESVTKICNYIDLNKDFKISSVSFSESIELKKADRLIAICKKENSNTYVNAYGGVELYGKEYFSQQGIELFFLRSEQITYNQKSKNFTPWLSIIDVLMFNSKEEIKVMLDKYELI